MPSRDELRFPEPLTSKSSLADINAMNEFTHRGKGGSGQRLDVDEERLREQERRAAGKAPLR